MTYNPGVCVRVSVSVRVCVCACGTMWGIARPRAALARCMRAASAGFGFGVHSATSGLWFVSIRGVIYNNLNLNQRIINLRKINTVQMKTPNHAFW